MFNVYSNGECQGPYKAFGHNYNEILGDFWMHIGEPHTNGNPWNYHCESNIMSELDDNYNHFNYNIKAK